MRLDHHPIKIFITIFRMTCVLATVIMMVYGIYRYALNEDVTTIEFKTFTGLGDGIYPSLSLCLVGPGIFDNVDLHVPHDQHTTPLDRLTFEYRNLLLGDIQNDALMNVSYDNVTFDFESERILKKVEMFPFGTDRGDWVEPMFVWESTTQPEFPFHISFKSAHAKCYSLNINADLIPELRNTPIGRIVVHMNKFTKRMGQMANFAFDIFLAYPNQLMRSMRLETMFKPHAVKDGEKMVVNIKVLGIETIQRRNKYILPCNQDWRNDDNMILDQLISKVGCRQEHWTNNLDIPVCTSPEQFASLALGRIDSINTTFLNDYSPPCREIQMITATSDVSTGPLTRKEVENNESLEHSITIFFQSPKYKEVKNVRSFNEESLVGNLGGYIGLFVGVALWNAPDIILAIVMKFKPNVHLF